MKTFDYIIIGAGTAGCVLANRLTGDGKYNVLLLEAGKKDNYFWIDIPVGYLYTINNPRTDWCYETEPDPGLNGRSIGYARGKVLGGCSSINAMIYMRGQKSDYDFWASLGNRGWSWDDVINISIIVVAMLSIIPLTMLQLPIFPTWFLLIGAGFVWVYFRGKKRD